MEHISDIMLLDYVAARLPASDSEQVRRHLAECGDCARRHREVLETWNALGKWQVDSAAHQIADRVEVLAAESESRRRSERKVPVPFRRPVFAALRIAAAILLAIGGGHLLGRFTAPSDRPTGIISTEKPQYLAALAFEWSSELTWTVLEEDVQSGEKQQ